MRQFLIAETHHREMRELGYTLLEGVFNAEDMSFVAGRIEANQRRRRDEETAGTGLKEDISFTPFLAEADPELMAFVKRPEFVAITTAFLGPDTDLYWNQAVYKPGGGTKPFPWHQDDGYTAVLPSPYLTLWIALNDTTVENGCIWVLPGTHRRGLVPHQRTPIGLECHSLDDADQGVPVPVKAGSVAAFWSLTMHKSGVNVSNEVRKSYIVQYAKAGLRHAESGEPVTPLTPVTRHRERASNGTKNSRGRTGPGNTCLDTSRK